jgi:Uma2 family endonuclease
LDSNQAVLESKALTLEILKQVAKEDNMNERLELENEFENQEIKMPSRNHSFAMGSLTGLLFNDKRFTVMPELSLDTSQTDLSQFGLKVKEELIPDISLYPDKVGLAAPIDELKMKDMPLLVIEILSPRQSLNDILAKFQAYFALGIKSCWLVIPAIKAITIYPQPDQSKTFGTNDTEIIDEVVDIRLPIQEIFGK